MRGKSDWATMDRTPSDTIFALASAPGRAGIAVMRVSGPKARDCVKLLTEHDIPKPRRAALRRVVDRDGEVIDQALMLWFPAPASVTGEDVAEFHVHGGRAIIEALGRELGAMAFAALPRQVSSPAVRWRTASSI